MPSDRRADKVIGKIHRVPIKSTGKTGTWHYTGQWRAANHAPLYPLPQAYNVRAPSASPQAADEKWDQARAMAAKAQEQGRLAQVKAAEAAATERQSAEAMRRAEVARGAEQELEVLPL